MTVAIGARYNNGIVIAADSKVVMSDGSTKIGCKVLVSQSSAGTIAIANATEDGNAATTLAEEIAEDLSKLKGGGYKPIADAIKNRMRVWYAGYGSPGAVPPPVQLLIGIVALGYAKLLFCQPPQTLVDNYVEPVSIGSGSASVDPLLPMVIFGQGELKATVLKVAYLMHRAKKEQGALVGGHTDMLVINRAGDYRCVPPEQVTAAEETGELLDITLRDCCMGLLGCEGEKSREEFLKTFNRLFETRAKIFCDLKFPCLETLP